MWVRTTLSLSEGDKWRFAPRRSLTQSQRRADILLYGHERCYHILLLLCFAFYDSAQHYSNQNLNAWNLKRVALLLCTHWTGSHFSCFPAKSLSELVRFYSLRTRKWMVLSQDLSIHEKHMIYNAQGVCIHFKWTMRVDLWHFLSNIKRLKQFHDGPR